MRRRNKRWETNSGGFYRCFWQDRSSLCPQSLPGNDLRQRRLATVGTGGRITERFGAMNAKSIDGKQSFMLTPGALGPTARRPGRTGGI